MGLVYGPRLVSGAPPNMLFVSSTSVVFVNVLFAAPPMVPPSDTEAVPCDGPNKSSENSIVSVPAKSERLLVPSVISGSIAVPIPGFVRAVSAEMIQLLPTGPT